MKIKRKQVKKSEKIDLNFASLFFVSNYVSSALNDGNYCIGVFLDLKKSVRCVFSLNTLKKTV